MRIAQKFTLWVITSLIIVLAIAIPVQYKLLLLDGIKGLSLLSRTVSSVIETSLMNVMLNKDFESLSKIIHEVSLIRPLKNIMIVNLEGTIKASSERSLVGLKPSYSDTRCLRCHEKDKTELLFEDLKILRTATPVENRKECQTCHSPQSKYNGVIIADFSVEEVSGRVKKNILLESLLFIAGSGLVGIMITIFTNNVITNRISKLLEGVRTLRSGEYETKINIKGKDEIAILAQNFEDMAHKIKKRDDEKNELISKLTMSRKEWQSTFDSIGDPVSIQDKNFNIIRVNRSFAEFFGIKPEEAIGKKCHQFFYESDTTVSDSPCSITMRENRPATMEVIHKSTNRILRISTFPYYNEEGKLAGAVHIAKDITEERDKETRLIMSERLAALGELASGIAHELNNPLASVSGCVEMLINKIQQKEFDTEYFKKYMKIIEEEIARCKEISQGMLSFVRRQTYEKKKIEINDVLEKTIEIVGLQRRLQNVEIKKQFGTLPEITASEGELRQVFLIIITNALDAMEDRGKLSLETFARENKIYVKIHDTGPGIPPEILPRIFTPFFTTKTDKGGTGLGLSIAKRIIKNYRGDIEVESLCGKGSTFTVIIPV